MAGYTPLYGVLREEFVQRSDEGCTIPAELRARFDALDAEKDACNTDKLDPIYDALMALPEDAALAAAEPNELDAIRALRPDGPRDLDWQPSEDELLDRLHGAWTGRFVGCALGKPVEGMGMSRDEDECLNGRKRIKAYLTKRNDWPLSDYFLNNDLGDDETLRNVKSCREDIAFMEADDDVHYSLVGLGILEEHGADFTWDDVARYWLSHIPITAICTAEAHAILNMQNCSQRGQNPSQGPEWVRRYHNPCREWIGAQIRSDGFAFCCAGRPERAAEFAWRDARWTHERNGIYGEMMFAAMQAAAFAVHDLDTLIRIGLSEIPRDCRLAQWVQKCMQWCVQYPDFESCMDRLEDELGEMHVVHTINNALICIIAMYYGGLDTTQTPAIAVMCGIDTDCNGASVGSIVGAIAGGAEFGGKLAGRLNDEVRPSMLGFQQTTMTELAQRTAKVRASL
jgi:ADP-ribosylglycohydrolase